VLVLRGLLALAFGIVAFAWPEITLTVLVMLFGAFVLVDGAVNLASLARREGRAGAPRWYLVLQGVLGVGIGAVALFLPRVTALALVILVAVWAFLGGALAVAAAIRLRRELKGEWLLVLTGLLSVLFALLIAFWPEAGLVALVWLVGFFALLRGMLLLSLGLRLRMSG
jgi:uncharacterized membrane protein HdeD (DUF308 family)